MSADLSSAKKLLCHTYVICDTYAESAGGGKVYGSASDLSSGAGQYP